MEVKKLNKKLPNKFKTIWFLWPTDKDRLLLLIKDYVKNYSKKKKTDKTAGEEAIKPYAELPTVLKDLNGCVVKDLQFIIKLLGRRGKILKNIEWLENEGKNASTEIAKVDMYNEALKKYIPVLNTKASLETINLHTAASVMDSINPKTAPKTEAKGKKSKEEQDADIVAAINYVGITVEKDDLGTYNVTTFKNGNGIKYFVGKTEKAFTLSKKTCNKYINEFLNKPLEGRKYITASQVFADYIKEAEKSLGVAEASVEDMKKLFGSSLTFKDPSVYFKNIIKGYSRHSKAWQNFKKEYAPDGEGADTQSHPDNLMAKKLVVGKTLSQLLNEGGVLTENQINNPDYKAGNISKDFGLDIDAKALGDESKYFEKFEDISFRAVSNLHSTLQELRSYNQDVTDDISLDYMKKARVHKALDEQRGELLEKKTDYDKKIAALVKEGNPENSKEMKYYEKQLEKVQEKLSSGEYNKANTDYISARNNFRRVLSLSKYYEDLLSTDIKIKKEKVKLSKQPITVEEVVEEIKNSLGEATEPTVKIDKGKISLDGMDKNKQFKKQYTLTEIDKEIDGLCREVDSDDAPVDYGDIRGELKKLKLKKDYARKKKLAEEKKVNDVEQGIVAGSSEGTVKKVGLTLEVLEKLTSNLAAVSNLQAQNAIANAEVSAAKAKASAEEKEATSTASLLDNDLTRELIELLLEDKKRELERRKNRGKRRIVEDYDDEEDYEDYDDYDDEDEVVVRKKSKKTKKSAIATLDDFVEEDKDDDIFSLMLEYEKNPNKTVEISSLDFGNDEDDEDDEEDLVTSKSSPNNDFMPMPNMYEQMNHYDATDMGNSVEPSIIPYLVAYQKDGVNTYGNYLEAFATFERYKYLVETKGNLLYDFVSKGVEAGKTVDDMLLDLRYRMLKACLQKSNIKLDDGVIAGINLDNKLSTELEPLIDKSGNNLVTSDYKEMTASINLDYLRFLIQARLDGDDPRLPEDVMDNLTTALNMLGSIANIIMGDPRTTKNYEKYSAKMKQSYIDTLVGKLEAGELPVIALDSDSIYKRMLDYLSFSIVSQNVLIQKSDAQEGGLTTYPRNVYFGQKELADATLRAGYVLTHEQNALITKRNMSLFEDLGDDVTNLFGTLYSFNGSHNKILLRMKPGPLQGGVKFMENLVDALKVDYNPGEIKRAESKKAERVESTAIVREGMQPCDYEDEDWFLRKRFILSKEKAKEYALQLAFGMKYGTDPAKTRLKEDFYEKNMLNLQKVNTYFKDIDENTISMITSVIRTMMTQTVDRYDDFVVKLDKQYLNYANKMLYIVEEIEMIADFDARSPEDKKYTINKIEEEFIAKSEDNTEIHPELTSPRKMVNAFMNLFRYYALTQLMAELGKDERIVINKFNDEFEKIKRDMRTFLIDKIKDSSRLNGYEIETAKYFELDIVVNDEERDNVRFADGTEVPRTMAKPLGTDLHNIDIIYAGIRQGFIQAIEQEGDPLLKEDMRDVSEVLDVVGEIVDDIESSTFEIKLPIGHTIKCNLRGLFQQYLFRYITDKGAETDSFEFILNEIKHMDSMADIARYVQTAAEDLNGEELGINLIMKFSSLSEDGDYVELGEQISTVMASIKTANTAEEVYEKLNSDAFYKSAVEDIQKMFLDYFKRKKSEQIVF